MLTSPKENLLAALRHEEPEWVPCPMVDGSWAVVSHGLVERPSEPGYDDWGARWDLRDIGIGTFPVEHPITRPEQVETHPFPDPEKPDLIRPAIEAAEKVDRRKSLLFGDNGFGLFERAWSLVGMERLLLWMVEEPRAVKALICRIAEVKIRLTERLIEEVKVDGIMFGDDWGWERGLLMGPKFWREFIKPEQRRLYEACKRKGVLINQHTDGKVDEIIPDLIEIGVDILNPVQPECHDLNRLKEEFGHVLTFHGAVSSRLLDKGRPEEVFEEVRVRINQLAPGGGFVLAPAHWVPYPSENLEAFKEAAKRFGRFPAKP